MCGLPSCHKNTVSSVPAKYSVLSMRLTSRCNLRVCSMLQSRPHIKFACGRGQVMKLDVHCEKKKERKKRSCHFVEDQKITKQFLVHCFCLKQVHRGLDATKWHYPFKWTFFIVRIAFVANLLQIFFFLFEPTVWSHQSPGAISSWF